MHLRDQHRRQYRDYSDYPVTLRHYWRSTTKKLQGFSFFVGHTDQWLRLFEWLIEDSWLPYEVKRSVAHVEF